MWTLTGFLILLGYKGLHYGPLSKRTRRNANKGLSSSSREIFGKRLRCFKKTGEKTVKKCVDKRKRK